MPYEAVFKRYELKYMITREKKERILRCAEEHINRDRYGRTSVRNVYFDTEDYRIIRRSIEKPCYKEKLRMRSYSLAEEGDEVFVELKKKHEGIVYKRRLALPLREAEAWLYRGASSVIPSQISREIDHLRATLGPLLPTVMLSYDREAYYAHEKRDFRITFDDNILFREADISLSSAAYGVPLLPSRDTVLMELKCCGGMPLWMARLLSEEKIYKTSFSKYGRAYCDHILPRINLIKSLNKREKISYGYNI